MTTSATSKNFALHGAHTAGIFADMTVDGPEIGTLVCVVDRAKNLPNRKTIGKQDPYCAARLGKEAKKTNTDIRGGQTPRWDQELRFTVHDTADYYQLKVSVFTDDKRTDLIGETWIDLKPIIIQGGGQNDMWQTLTCRGKYAGEIRLEITYYDTRPKPEKSATKPKPPSPVQQEGVPNTRRRDVIKRRPLSTVDPVSDDALPPIVDTIPRGHVRLQSYPDFTTPSASARGRHSLGMVGGPRELRPVRKDPNENARHSEEREISQKIPVSPYDQPDPRGDYNYASDREEQRAYHSHGAQPPPPPPAHRAKHHSHEALRGTSLEAMPQKVIHPAPLRHDVLKNENQRKASPSYPGRPKFGGQDCLALTGQSAPPLQKTIAYDTPAMRDSYDAYDPHRSMQPTVEDYPESEAGGFAGNYRHGSSRMYKDDANHDNAYEHGAMAAPNKLNRSPGASAGYPGQHPGRISREYPGARGHAEPVPAMPPMDYVEAPAQVPYHSHGSRSRHGSRNEAEMAFNPSSSGYALHDLPSSLTPGVDPTLYQDTPYQTYDERRYEGRQGSGGGGQSMVVSRRDGQRSEPPIYDAPVLPPQSSSVQKYDTGRSDMHYYNTSSDSLMSRLRNVSPNPAPNPSHAIRRKSVSPAPPPADTRRLSDVPYGPDSYDSYNPTVSRGGTPGSDPEVGSAKIVTYDGREIDPSDHLPIESWAPEPEQKPTQAPAESRSRPALTGAQPMPPNGRRQLRVRAQSSASPSQSYDDLRPSGEVPPARGRLQKKANRAPTGGHSPSGREALASASSDDLHDRQGHYSHSRASQYSSDSYAPRYPGAQGPPIPAKVPLPIMSGANGENASLMEEMSKIDIGTGRSRRRGGY